MKILTQLKPDIRKRENAPFSYAGFYNRSTSAKKENSKRGTKNLDNYNVVKIIKN